MTARKVGLRRLLKLADHMETVDMIRFMDSSKDETGSGWLNYIADCTCMFATIGSTAAHATEIPSFRKAGYKLSKTQDGLFELFYRNKYNNDALILFFGLEFAEVGMLFHSQRIETPKQAAKHIRGFVKAETTSTSYGVA